jgi:hypothetical protein
MLQPLSRISTTDQLVEAINAILRGRSNAVGTVTLTANDTSTVINDPRISNDSAILLQPTTANAAGALGTTYIAVVNGMATINHANAVSVDRIFKYVVHG